MNKKYLNNHFEIYLYLFLTFITFSTVLIYYYQYNLIFFDTLNLNFILTLFWIVVLVVGAFQFENIILKSSSFLTLISIPTITFVLFIISKFNEPKNFNFYMDSSLWWNSNNQENNISTIFDIHFFIYILIIISLGSIIYRKNKEIFFIFSLTTINIYLLKCLFFI